MINDFFTAPVASPIVITSLSITFLYTNFTGYWLHLALVLDSDVDGVGLSHLAGVVTQNGILCTYMCSVRNFT